LTLVRREIEEIFAGMGFEVRTGPWIETEWNNFDALNTPADHPARDMQDTFFVEGGLILRSHTSPVQVRTMLAGPPPVKIIAPGNVFRRDDDATHTPMFPQVEGLHVDRDVSFEDLKATLFTFVQRFFGPATRIRLRPSFFPFTEPSAEVDASCFVCEGQLPRRATCRLCKTTGWLEIGGSGMVHPNVFKAVGYDQHDVTGFAFGMGLSRMAMLKYGVTDLRLFYENDLRFLEQFPGR
jgi:phenylalanyl-tRNA synthetase alpha chain